MRSHRIGHTIACATFNAPLINNELKIWGLELPGGRPLDVSGHHFGASGCLWAPLEVIVESLGGSGGASADLWLPFWGLGGLRVDFSWFQNLLVLKVMEKVSVSPQRGGISQSPRFSLVIMFSRR